jgi:urea carboxylase / allophanate hydrolase
MPVDQAGPRNLECMAEEIASQPPLTIADWKAAHAAGGGVARLQSVVASEQAANWRTRVWISLATPVQLQEQWDALASTSLPLYGIPFAVKDNINAKGFPTTAGCPAFASGVVDQDSTVVAKLKAAGAILIGKTNLDQFATGLVGTRSPYGAVPNSFNPSYVSGGSSSGSAIAVARGVVPFSLGTDTAGSGRVPAGLNNIYGLKPTRGAISAQDVVPACRSLDCVSIFALVAEDAELVLSIAEGFDEKDAYSRTRPTTRPSTGFGASSPAAPKFAVCKDPQWFGDDQQAAAYEAALVRTSNLGWEVAPVNFEKLFALAQLLYDGPWVAERYAAIRSFIEKSPVEALDPTVRKIILQAQNFTAADAFAAEYLRQDITREIQLALNQFDGILVPTAPTFPTLAALQAEPVIENSKLGTYTNFVNLLDWCALSIPAGFRADGLPFGITLISSTWRDADLLKLSRQWTAGQSRRLGATQQMLSESAESQSKKSQIFSVGKTEIAVVGAHLRGLSLNSHLVSRGATFSRLTTTSSAYRLYALPNTEPRKPGLCRALAGEAGSEIEVEVWELPDSEWAGFMKTIPYPLAIGSIELKDGSRVPGFICEHSGIQGATDITAFGGWRSYLKSNQTLKTKAITSVLIANRGEIAVRIMKTLRALNIRGVAIYSDDDAEAPHVRDADVALRLEGSTVSETYINGRKILELAKSAGVDAIIPGYGFLSENADFARAVEAHSFIWVGPTPDQMSELGLKHRARAIASEAGVPTVPGSEGLLSSLDDAVREAQRIGFPLMVKSTAGGGGIGLRHCTDLDSLKDAFESVKRLATANFADAGVFLERFIKNARHVEIQVLGDGTGRVLAAGDRDCSLQRRHQKVVEESPAVIVPEAVRRNMQSAAIKLASAVKYRNVGTVEFIYDVDSQDFFFLEVNTRLQVEHPVTESVTGLDLVKCMLKIANQDFDDLFERSNETIATSGASIEARIYAEDPILSFQPCSGQITHISFPQDLRVDTWIQVGTKISTSYDPMLAKIIATGKDRQEAIEKLWRGLMDIRIDGVGNNLEYLRQIVSSEMFTSGLYSTKSLDAFQIVSPCLQIIEPGGLTSIQDYPGRKGLWSIGIPPSGPMDNFSFRLANCLVGNDEGMAGFECTLRGPVVRFYNEAVIAVTGAKCTLRIDGAVVPTHQALKVLPGQTLDIGAFETGYRAYLAVAGGLKVPSVLGSRSTLELAKLGGHQGRRLAKNDVIQLNLNDVTKLGSQLLTQTAPPVLISNQPNAEWTIGVIAGPHGSPDSFDDSGVSELFGAKWTVHYNSNRSGVRLTGPRPKWSRKTGGTAGLHPSNIHDAPYTIGSVSFTGDEAVVLTADGPTLGGFVTFCVVASAELWKLGQVRPGDVVKFKPISGKEASELEKSVNQALVNLVAPPGLSDSWSLGVLAADNVVGQFSHNNINIIVQQSGDHALLMSFGDEEVGFEIHQSLEVFAFVQHHHSSPIEDVEELSPGVRTLHVRCAPQAALAVVFKRLVEHIESYTTPSKVTSRNIRLPLAYNDTVTQAAVDRYSVTIRSKAPWLPSNVTFLEQLNGIDDLNSILQKASFLVLGLGDVYNGSPCAVPLDPRHRLFGTKYNPSRSYTPRGAVGIGGQYMCIYGTDSPGGYQLVGRTIDIWDTAKISEGTETNVNPTLVSEHKPWLFRLFDRITFYPVSEAELDNKPFDELVHISSGVFDVSEYQAWLLENQKDITQTIKKFAKIRDNALLLEDLVKPYDATTQASQKNTSPLQGHKVRAPMPGRCWKVLVKEGDKLEKGAVVVSPAAVQAWGFSFLF